MADQPTPQTTTASAAAPAKKKSGNLAPVIFFVFVAVVVIPLVLFVAFSAGGDAAKNGEVKEGEFKLGLNDAEKVSNDLRQVSVQVTGLEKRLADERLANSQQREELAAMRRRLEETTALGGSQAAGDDLTKELATFPDEVRSEFPAAVSFLDEYALSSGTFDPVAALPAFTTWMRNRNQTATNEQIRALANVARVRRKALTDDQYQQLPRLAAKRAALGIPKDKVFAIAKLVWQQRNSLPAMSAGQILSMATLAGQTTADVAVDSGGDDVEAASTGRTGRSSSGSDWALAASNQVALPRSVAFGPIMVTPLELRQAAHAVIPEIATSYGFQPSTAAGAQGIAYASMLLDGRVNMLLQGDADPLLTYRLLDAIREDLTTGSKISVAYELTSDAVTTLSAEQSVALRAAIVGTVAGRSVATGSEPVLETSLLPGLLPQPDASLIRVVVGSRGDDEGGALLDVVDRASKLSGASPIPATTQALRRQMKSSSGIITETAAALTAARIPAPAIRQIDPLLPLAVALAQGREAGGTAGNEGGTGSPARSAARFATAAGAQALVLQHADADLIPRYKRDYPTINLDWQAVRGDIIARSAQTCQDALLRQLVQVKVPSDVVPAISTIRQSATSQAEGAIAKALVRQVVQAGIAQASIGRDRILLDGVKGFIDQRLETLMIPEYNDDKIRAVASSITRDATAILTGKRDLPAAQSKPAANTSARGPGTGGGNIENELGVVNRQVGGEPIGARSSNGTAGGAVSGVYGFARLDTSNVGSPKGPVALAGPSAGRGRAVTIQSGSYGQAYIYSGVEVSPVGGVRRRMTFNLTHSLKGSGPRPLVLKNLRVVGEAYACPGSTTRLYVDLLSVSIKFPSGMTVERACDGYVNDHVLGVDGVIGEYNLNMAEVGLPLTLAGLFKGIGIGTTLAANNGSTSITVNNGTTGVENNAPNTGKAIAGAAITEAADPMVDYLKRATAPIGPTIIVKNGSPVTVFLAKPVVFDGVPESEWRSLEGEESNNLFSP